MVKLIYSAMLSKFTILCFICAVWFTSTREANGEPEKTVQIQQSELDDLNAKRDELVKLKQQYESDKKTWENDKKKLQDENKDLKNKMEDLEDFELLQRKVWTLLWFRWLSLIKYEIEWRETVVTNFTFDRNLFEEKKSKNKIWTEPEEYRRQVWVYILNNCTENPHIISLLHQIEKVGIDFDEFSESIAYGYKEINSKLLSMMRWRNLPKFEKQPTFNTPITWSPQVNKCLLTLMFDVDKYMAWEFKTDLALQQEQETVKPRM